MKSGKFWPNHGNSNSGKDRYNKGNSDKTRETQTQEKKQRETIREILVNQRKARETQIQEKRIKSGKFWQNPGNSNSGRKTDKNREILAKSP